MLQYKHNPPIKEIIETCVIPRFIELSRNHQYGPLQNVALLVLANIASGDRECTKQIIDNDGHILLN